jgi:nucleoside-diphosphate-sugar epimerase
MRISVAGGAGFIRRAVVDRLRADSHDVVEHSAAGDLAGEDPGVATGRDLLVVLGGSEVVQADSGAREIAGRVLAVVRRGNPGEEVAAQQLAAREGKGTVLRVPHVYGPGDALYGALVTMVRTMPMLPVPDAGDRRQQPLAVEDLAEAVAHCVKSPPDARTLDLAGPDETSLEDLLDRVERIVGRGPPRFPVPESVLSAGMQLAASFGFEVETTENPLLALSAEDALPEGSMNGLLALGVTPTPLDVGLRRLVEELPEQLPSEEDGEGEFTRRRWWAHITGSNLDPAALFAWFRGHFRECMEATDIGQPVNQDAPFTLDPGVLLTFDAPLRGQVQLRVIEVTGQRATLATVRGHPLAAAIMMGTASYGAAVRFEITAIERAATDIDALALAAGGSWLEHLTMSELVECVVRASGGEAIDGVQEDEQALVDDDAELAEAEIASLLDREEDLREQE